MLKWRKAPHWAYDDFFNGTVKPSFCKRILSYLTALILVPLMKSQRHIKVYRDKRAIETFNQSLKALVKGESLIIFPECRKQYGRFINDFHGGFTAIAKFYFLKTGKKLKFVPVYVAPKLNTMNFGKAIEYEENCDLHKLCNDLRDSIEEIGGALPEHKIITYSDIIE